MCSRMAEKISALILSALASEAENPKASKTLPLTTWVGLFSDGFFIGSLLLQPLVHQFQTLARNINVSPIGFAAIFFEAMQHLNYIADFGQVDGTIPRPFVCFFQLENAGAYGTHAARLTGCGLPHLKLAERKAEISPDSRRESR